jgi:cytochrome c peroxidase
VSDGIRYAAAGKSPGILLMLGRCMRLFIFVAFFTVGCGVWSIQSGTLRIEFDPHWDNERLILDRQLKANVARLSVARADWLISELGLKRPDGTWLEAPDWTAFISVGKGRLHADADGLPNQEFTAIRFRIGLRDQIDQSDPQGWEPDHPLHPDVNGLHWGWSGGYVFMAIEGHWEEEAGKVSGFSYHLAGATPPMLVEIPVRFSGTHGNTIRIAVDFAPVLKGGSIVSESESTHSRDGDEVATRMKNRVSDAFRLSGVYPDIFHAEATVLKDKRETEQKFNSSGTPFQLQVSQRLPKIKLPSDNPLTEEGVALGRELFHDARLSRGNAQSCASCHEVQKSFTDGRSYSVGVNGTAGRRNSMPLVNLAWADEFFWDGRAKSLREQVLMPIQDTHEMNESLEAVLVKLAADPTYARKFAAAFGSEQITSARIAFALEQFLLTLVSQDSKFDRAARRVTELTPQEQRGLKLFVTEHDPARGLRGADCFHCHGGNLFSNHQFINNGLRDFSQDAGRMEVTGKESDRGKFKVPSLRNVALTAPYMHDGRFQTLEEVVEHYNSGVQRTRTLDPNLAKHPESGLGLTDEDKKALVAFLKTLTDENFTQESPKQFSQAK